MKKLLFTLASLVAFGFAANAGIPTFAFGQSEVTMGAGETQEMTIQLTSIDEMVKAIDWTFQMVDPDGNLMTDKVKLQYLQKYGSRTRYQFFGKTGITIDNENTVSTSDGAHANNATMTTTGIYKLIVSNAGSNVCYYDDESTPADVFLFTVEIEDGWDKPYADLVMTQGSIVMYEQGAAEVERISMRIYNADYQEPVTPDQPLAGEIVIGEVDENGNVTVNYTGNEDVTIRVMVDGVYVPVVDGKVNVGTYGDHEITVEVSAEGYETKTETFNVTYDEPVTPPAPYETPAPTVNVETDAEAQVVTITATGEGTVTIYVNYFDGNGPVAVATGEGEATFEIPFGEEVAYVAVYATAQRDDDAIAGSSTSEYVEVPQKSDEPTPPTPGDHTYQLVLVHNDGVEEIIDLMLGKNGDYIEVVDLTYPTYHYVANFYFLIDGVAYGANQADTEAFLGEAERNPLTEGNNNYYVNVGFSYTIGIHFIYDQDTMEFQGYSAYVAKGGPTDVEELNADKAIANVRYFNMAGQEMQEANGMTIVVTTYTDGTTSAVKVMK